MYTFQVVRRVSKGLEVERKDGFSFGGYQTTGDKR